MIPTTGPIDGTGPLKDLFDIDKSATQDDSSFMDILQALLGGQLSADELVAWLEGQGLSAEEAAAFVQSMGIPLPQDALPAEAGQGLGDADDDNTGQAQRLDATIDWDQLDQADAEALLLALQGRLDETEQVSEQADVAAKLLTMLTAARGAGESTASSLPGAGLDQQLAQQRWNAWMAGEPGVDWQGSGGKSVSDVLATDALRTAALSEAQANRVALDANFLAQLQQRTARSAEQEPRPLSGDSALGSAAEGLREAGANLQPASFRPASGVPTYNLPTPVNQPDWGRAMGERLTTLVRDGIQHARIHLNPPNLGPVEVFVTVNDDRAQVQMTAQHATTREALETEMPRLRAMLDESGFSSVDVGVSQQQGDRDGTPARNRFDALLHGDDAADADGNDEHPDWSTAREPRGLVDHYV